MKNGSAPARPGDAKWRAALIELREEQRWCRRVARSLGLDPRSAKAEVIREIVLSRIFSSSLNKSRRPGALLRELHQVLKATPGESATKKGGPRKSLRQHLEQLYGPGVVVVENVDDEEPKEKPS